MTGLAGYAPRAQAQADCLSETGVDCSGVGQEDVASAPSPNQPDSSLGNPVNLITGNKYQREDDYRSTGSRLAWSRHYNSANSKEDFALGFGWTHSLLAVLQPVSVSAPSGNLTTGFDILQSNGRRVRFRQQDTNTSGTLRMHATTPSDGYVIEAGNYRIWQLPDGRSLRFKGPLLVNIEFPGQENLAFFYQNNRISKITDEDGRTLSIEYTEGNLGLLNYETDQFMAQPAHINRVVLPDGSEISYDYDSQANLVRANYADGTHRQYHYEDTRYPHQLTGLTDRTGQRYASWSYNLDGAAVSSEHANGVERVTLDYEYTTPAEEAKTPNDSDEFGTTTVTNSLGEVSRYNWHYVAQAGHTLLLGGTGPGCTTCPATGVQYTYTKDYQIQTAVWETGSTSHYAYDDIGRLVEHWQTFSDGSEKKQRRYTYNDNATRPALVARPSINPLGSHITETLYNPDGLPTQVIERGFEPTVTTTTGDITGFKPIERTTRLIYSDGLLVALDGPRDDVEDTTRFRYFGAAADLADSSAGDSAPPASALAGIDLPDGQSININRYDVHGRPIEFRLGEQSPVVLSYDNAGNITQLSQRGNTISYRYDAEGRLTHLTDANGKLTRASYDAAGRLSRVTDDLGRVTKLLHDSESRVTNSSFYGLDGNIIRSFGYVFDAAGRLSATSETATNEGNNSLVEHHADFTYNNNGRLSSAANPDNNQKIDLAYNPLGNLLSRTDPGAGADATTTKFHYDNKGQQIALTDARGNATQFIKDDFGRVVALISPDTGTTRYQYDASNNRIRKTTADNDTISYTWDAGNRLVAKRSSDGLTSFEYHTDNGKLIKTSNAATTETYAYNVDAQLTGHTRLIGDLSFTTGYSYDERGRLLRKHLPDGTVLRHHYHADGPNQGLLRAITRESLLGLVQQTLLAEIDLDTRNGSSGYLSHNGLRTQHTYTASGSLQAIDVSNTLKLDYHFDDAGNITGINENGFQQNFSYQSGRLSSAITTAGDFHYQYDNLGNRTHKQQKTSDGVEQATAYNIAAPGQGNRLLSTTDENTGTTTNYLYNHSGSPSRQPENIRTVYNVDQRPVQVFKNEHLFLSYQYNSFGERISKTSYANGQETVTLFLYESHKISIEVNPANGKQKNTIYLGPQPVLRLQNDNTYALHSDHLGTVRMATDGSGELVWSANYTPFGSAQVTTQHIALNLRLPGQYLDVETGTHYNYLRTYDPQTGRYQTSDPISLQGGANTYLYAMASPYDSIDPYGLQTLNPAAGPVPPPQLMGPLLAAAARVGIVVLQGAAVAGTTVAAVVTSPVVVTGVGLTALATVLTALHLHFEDQHNNNEQELILELGYQPTPAIFNFIHDQIRRYDSSNQFLSRNYNGFQSIFEAQLHLERAQRDFIHEYEALQQAPLPEFCDDPINVALYNEALAAIALADSLRNTGSSPLSPEVLAQMQGEQTGPIILEGPDTEPTIPIILGGPAPVPSSPTIVGGPPPEPISPTIVGGPPPEPVSPTLTGTPVTEPAGPVIMTSTSSEHDAARPGERPNSDLSARPEDRETNHDYIVNGHITYTTDENGNVVQVEATLDSASVTTDDCRRVDSQQSDTGHCGYQEDEGGHLIAHCIGGPGERINMVPMDGGLNRGAGSPWRAMETAIQTAIDNGSVVEVTQTLIYGDPTMPNRPTNIEVSYTVDGEDAIEESFENECGTPR